MISTCYINIIPVIQIPLTWFPFTLKELLVSIVFVEPATFVDKAPQRDSDPVTALANYLKAFIF